MTIIRIFQIAKELNISHTDILSFLNSRGVDVKSHMSPVDDEVHKLIMSEFAKDKKLVDRFRKEQVRKEIHDTRLKEKQESQKKLQLLSLQEQREIEKTEKIETEKEKQKIGDSMSDVPVNRVEDNEVGLTEISGSKQDVPSPPHIPHASITAPPPHISLQSYTKLST